MVNKIFLNFKSMIQQNRKSLLSFGEKIVLRAWKCAIDYLLMEIVKLLLHSLLGTILESLGMNPDPNIETLFRLIIDLILYFIKQWIYRKFISLIRRAAESRD